MSKRRDPLANVTRLGIDEVAYRKGHRYLTIVVDHDTGLLLFARPGKDEATLDKFFDRLGPEKCERIRLVSIDAGVPFRASVRKRGPKATLCLDPSTSWHAQPKPSTRFDARSGTSSKRPGRRSARRR